MEGSHLVRGTRHRSEGKDMTLFRNTMSNVDGNEDLDEVFASFAPSVDSYGWQGLLGLVYRSEQASTEFGNCQHYVSLLLLFHLPWR